MRTATPEHRAPLASPSLQLGLLPRRSQPPRLRGWGKKTLIRNSMMSSQGKTQEVRIKIRVEAGTFAQLPKPAMVTPFSG